MQVNANSYKIFYEILRDKFLKDFYPQGAENINPVDVWNKRFPKGDDNSPGEVISRALFDLDDLNGRYFHVKLKESEKAPAIFNIKDRRVYKALMYLKEGYSNDPASFNQRQIIYEDDIKKEARKLWDEFEKKFVFNPNTPPQIPPSET